VKKVCKNEQKFAKSDQKVTETRAFFAEIRKKYHFLQINILLSWEVWRSFNFR